MKATITNQQPDYDNENLSTGEQLNQGNSVINTMVYNYLRKMENNHD